MRLAILVAGFVLALPASAGAASTVGSPLTEAANYFTACDSSPDPADACTVTQTSSPDPGTLTSPVTGVITAWRLRSISIGTVTLRVLRPNEDGTWTAIGSSLPQSLTQRPSGGSDARYTFKTRIAVQQGDRIGVDRDRRAGGIYRATGNSAFSLGVWVPPLPDFESAPPAQGEGGVELMVAADVEADADGDGFGDETQDNCPKIANDQSSNPCPPADRPPATSPGSGDTGPARPFWRRHKPRRRATRPSGRGPTSDTFRYHNRRR